MNSQDKADGDNFVSLDSFMDRKKKEQTVNALTKRHSHSAVINAVINTQVFKSVDLDVPLPSIRDRILQLEAENSRMTNSNVIDKSSLKVSTKELLVRRKEIELTDKQDDKENSGKVIPKQLWPRGANTATDEIVELLVSDTNLGIMGDTLELSAELSSDDEDDTVFEMNTEEECRKNTKQGLGDDKASRENVNSSQVVEGFLPNSSEGVSRSIIEASEKEMPMVDVDDGNVFVDSKETTKILRVEEKTTEVVHDSDIEDPKDVTAGCRTKHEEGEDRVMENVEGERNVQVIHSETDEKADEMTGNSGVAEINENILESSRIGNQAVDVQVTPSTKTIEVGCSPGTGSISSMTSSREATSSGNKRVKTRSSTGSTDEHTRAKKQKMEESFHAKIQQNFQDDEIRAKIQKLKAKVKQEQAIIIQTTNALTQCCSKNSIFAGSQEQVECNKLLLIASQRRQVYLAEIDQLKEAPEAAVTECRGSLTISDLRLPLKKDFLSKIGSKEDLAIHYFILLLKNGTNLLVTEMVSSHDSGVTSSGALEIPNLLKLQDVGSHFNFTLEIYSMSIVREPEQEKSKKAPFTPTKLLTPRKLLSKRKGSENPVTAMTVSTTDFRLLSSVTISLKSVQNTTFLLEGVPTRCPLQGLIGMKFKCILESSVEHRGFLTVFEDVAGMGSWDRRWCALSNNQLKFWKYPDVEKTQVAMKIIDLKFCITELVSMISRDECARPNTFRLLTMRPPQAGDKNTITSWKVGTMTKFKHLLAADSKSDLAVWCEKLNEGLKNIRTWQPDALRPLSGRLAQKMMMNL